MNRILLVEGDPHFRGVIERLLLRSYSCVIASVATGKTAQDELSRQSFDLVIIDLDMEEGKNWDTLRRAIGNPGNPAAIVFSSEDTPVNMEYAKSCGAFDFLSKPFDYGILKTAIDSALQEPKRGGTSNRMPPLRQS